MIVFGFYIVNIIVTSFSPNLWTV